MTTEQAMLAAIWAAPHDDLPRLVYADWLDETGDPANIARAEFIRVQCELTRVGRYDDRTDQLLEAEKRLLDESRASWLPRQRLRHGGVNFDRGFLSPSYRSDLKTIQSEAPIFGAVAPLWEVRLDAPDDFDWLRKWPPAQRIQTLHLTGTPPRWGNLVAQSPLLRNLRRLHVDPAYTSVSEFGRLCQAKHLTHLTELILPDFETTSDLLAQLLTATYSVLLRTLMLCHADDFRSDGFVELLASPTFPRLDRLVLCTRDPSYEWGRLLHAVAGVGGKGMACLVLFGGAVSPDGCLALLQWPGAASLRHLDLSPQTDAPRADTCLAMLESDRLPSLKTLTVRPSNPEQRMSKDPKWEQLCRLADDKGVKLDVR